MESICGKTDRGGVLASTWVVKQKEHTGAHEDPVKNVHFCSFKR